MTCDDQRLRAFIAIEVSDEVRDGLQRLQRELDAARAKVGWVRREHMHLTLAFLGDIESGAVAGVVECMAAAARGMTAFTCEAAGAGCFGGERSPRVLWAGVRDAGPLAALQARLAAELRARGHALEERSFTPHLTIGRVRSTASASGLAPVIARARDRHFGRFEVRGMLLFRSRLGPDGPEHTVMHEALLGAATGG
jgi:2'-5' RNA ligase